MEFLCAPLPGALREGRPDVDVLAVVHEVVDDRALELLPKLRLVANYGVGYETIDIDACARRDIAVTNTPSVLDAATADLTLALILACRRRLVEADQLVRKGRWTDSVSDLLLSDDVTGAVLGIVGLGRIGRAVARRARAFEMCIIYSQRTRLPQALERELGVEYRELDRLLAQADVVSLHCPLTQDTAGLIDSRRLGLLKEGACLINVARGEVVDEAALVAHLQTGRLIAGLDVFAHEPDVPHALFHLPNIVLSPHLGSATLATREAMTRLLVDNILALEAGRPLLTPVEPGGESTPHVPPAPAGGHFHMSPRNQPMTAPSASGGRAPDGRT